MSASASVSASLLAALKTHGRHLPTCDARTCAVDGAAHLGKACHELPKKPCSCGLDAALAHADSPARPPTQERKIEAQLAEIERHDPGFIDAVKAYYGVESQSARPSREEER